MVRTEENISSKSVGITFIGFREDLVIPFIEKLRNYKVNKFVLVYSLNKPSNELWNLGESLISKTKDIIKSNFESATIEEVISKNIWNFYEHLKLISGIKAGNFYVNVSAGPSTFSSAMTLYCVLKGHHIFYHVEGGLGSGSFFVEADLTSLKYYYSLDFFDKKIISIIGSSRKTRKEIHRELQKIESITERSIGYRIESLVSKGLLIQSGKRPYEYTLPDPLVYLL